MTDLPVYIASVGIVSPLGHGLAATEAALRQGISALAPLHLFPLLQGDPLAVGQVAELEGPESLPQTHRLAREAARMAMAGATAPPDAVLLGCTTGGILTTEELLRQGVTERKAYAYHGLASLTDDIAALCGCLGPAIAVSTACSSSAVALALALKLIRSGRMTSILVGGVDSLSRLTYFGFHSLQLIDRLGCRPLDEARQGMSVAEGAAMLLLTSRRPAEPLAVLQGAGLSCDAHHATAPHPEGLGAIAAIRAALADAGIDPAAINYINLHGTGTPDNDLAEARAITAVFPSPPPLSSIKGATGHSLAAAGALEAVAAILAITKGFIPGNVGCSRPDPALQLAPQMSSQELPVARVLSNSFGFGGNNGCVIIGRDEGITTASPTKAPLAIHGYACLTGAGLTEESLATLAGGSSAAGMIAGDRLAAQLPPRLVRRIKRLSRLALLLAITARDKAPDRHEIDAVFMGTGWGALSETYDFLTGLEQSAERFPSPTDFIGSVHNGAASQIAIHCKAKGANVTTSGGDYSFEQALLAADTLLAATGQTALVLAADEGHSPLSALLDPSIDPAAPLADGGGALLVSRQGEGALALISIPFYEQDPGLDPGEVMARLVAALGGPARIASDYAAVLVGMPAASATQGQGQLQALRRLLAQPLPCWSYRPWTGQFASASAVATAVAVSCLVSKLLPPALTGGAAIPLGAKQKILVLGTGRALTAIELARP